MTAVRFTGITKRYGRFEALQPTDLDMSAGEFVSLLGPSGSGKTTLLNICAGYIEPSAGKLEVNGKDVTTLPARKRNMGMVFQNYALFPHMSVFENIAYGLRARHMAEEEITRRVGTALASMRLTGFESRATGSLSGGQQQRIALARAMVIEPDILLMDEPLGALDRQLRKEVQLEIRRMHQASPRTTLYVTHDQEEALVMSDRIAVMHRGRIVQIGRAEQLYHRPANTFVASFLGESNLLSGSLLGIGSGRATLAVDGLPQPVEGVAAGGLALGGACAALIRPEQIRIVKDGLPARVVERVFIGEIVALRLRLDCGLELWSRRFTAEAPEAEMVQIGWDRDAVSILPET
jgi:ABC-type Fe3+/spermidine/putrescine transport system ATPase subunit